MVRGTPGTKARRDSFEVEIGDPVFDGGAPAERDDNELVCGVQSNVARNVCCKFAGRISVSG